MNPSKAELLASIAVAICDRTIDRDVSSGHARTQLNGVLIGLNEARDLVAALPDEPAPSPDFFAENANNSPSPADECDHDFVLQHSSSINICRHCGIVETPSIAGRMAAKRALKEAFKHFDAPSPTTGAVVQWTEAHNAATYLQHHIGEGDEGACNALDTIDKFVLSHPAPSPTKPEGLEWRHLKRGTVYTEIGRGRMQCSTEFAADDEDVVIYRGQDGAIWVRLVKEFEDGRFERLSPVSDTTDTVRVKREDALDDTPLERCHADRDGDCNHPNCPQLRDNEPHTTGRHCPIDTWEDADQ